MARTKLIEKIIVKASEIKPIPLTESMKVIESDGKSYRCLAAFTFPISRPGEKNLNERIYPEALWENVLKKEQGEGRFGLCDHPSEKSTQPDGSVKDAFCVWHNLRFAASSNGKRNLMLADCYLFGEWGRHAKEAIDAGGEIGLSSVGFGDFLDDGITIDPDTYDLDRPADWVLNPSYEVFGHGSDEILGSAEEEPAPAAPAPGEIEDSVKPSVSPIMKESSMANTDAIRKREEKTFRLQISALMAEAERKPTLHEKKSEYLSMLEYFDEGMATSDLQKTIEEKIAEIEKQIFDLAEAGKGVPELTTANKSLEERTAALTTELDEAKKTLENRTQEMEHYKENFEKASTLLDSLKAYSTKLKEMYDLKDAELETRITVAEYKELQVYSEGLEAQIEELKKALRKKEKATPAAPAAKKEGEEIETPAQDISPAPDLPNSPAPEDEPEVPAGDELDLPAITPMVGDYYEDLVARNPNVAKIKEDILRCRTLIEAETTYLRLRSLTEDRSLLYHKDPRREVKPVTRMHRENGDEQRASASPTMKVRKGWV